jgi:hypothetical protein
VPSAANFLQSVAQVQTFLPIPRLRAKFSDKLVFLLLPVINPHPTPNFLNRGPRFVGCQRLHIQYVCSCGEQLMYPQLESTPWRGDQFN